MVETI